MFRRKKEVRADPNESATMYVENQIRGYEPITKSTALNIPSVQGCINFVANTVAMIPIKLYLDNDGKAEEVQQDQRTFLLNDDTRDTLDASQFWRALITDYFLGQGGYAYIRKQRNSVVSLHYVDESMINVQGNNEPIFKDYDISVNGVMYKPFEFLKILRNTKDGASGRSIIADNSLILSVAYNSMIFEEKLVKKGGNKKGFLKATNKLDKEALTTLRAAWDALYSNGDNSVAVLNDGTDFKELSNTSVEMQLNENKDTNAIEICKIFNISPNVITGKGTHEEYTNSFRTGVMPILIAIESALNKDLLFEKEKQSYYFAFDTKEMLKGDIKTRFEAYRVALESNFMLVDEVRYMEDLPALGVEWMNLRLDSALYDLKSKTIYTPNTNKTSGESDT